MMEIEEVVAVATTITTNSPIPHLRIVATITGVVEIECHIHISYHPQVGRGRTIIRNNNSVRTIDPMNIAHYSDQMVEIMMSMVVGTATTVATTTIQTLPTTKLHHDGATRKIPSKQNPPSVRSPNVVEEKRRSFAICIRQIRLRKTMRSIDVRYKGRGGRSGMVVDGRDGRMKG